MFSTIKRKILFAVSLVMVVTALVNIYFTHRDVGRAMLTAQQDSALNILNSLNLIIEGDYRRHLSEKRSLTLSKRRQLKETAMFIASVFKEFSDTCGGSEAQGFKNALEWLKNAPFSNVNFYIVDCRANVVATSDPRITNASLKTLRDIKQREIARVMRFGNLAKRGDFAAFNLEDGQEEPSVLAYFLPFDPWKLTLGVSVRISRLQAQANKQKTKIISSLIDHTQALKIADTGFVYVFSKEGERLVPPQDDETKAMDKMVNQLTGNLVNEDIRSHASEEFSQFQYLPDTPDKKNRRMIAHCYYFKPFKWYISVMIPIKEIHLPARRLVIRQSLIIVIMFMLGIAAIVVVVSRIATPLNRLSSYARIIPTLDFSKPMDEATPVDDLPERYKDEVGALAASFILMRHELSRNIQDLINITAARHRIESELNIAREIQLGMVPKTFPGPPQFDQFDLYAILEPAKEVGGDLYDFFHLDDDHMVFSLGDVSGKGVPSALFMVVTRTLIRVFSEKELSPGRMMTVINNVLSSDNPQSMLVTLVIGTLNIRTGRVIYANGGHNPPIIIKEDGAEFIKGKNEPLVGAMPGIEYSDSILDLGAGHGFMLYTDGVNESMNEAREQFSNQSLIEQVSKDRDLSSKEVIHNLLGRVRSHAHPAPQSDDIAMLMVKFNKKT